VGWGGVGWGEGEGGEEVVDSGARARIYLGMHVVRVFPSSAYSKISFRSENL
jgi:hypothetical protein